MAEVLVFHHGYGLTIGVREFAERLRRAGHTVHVPDLHEGHVFGSLEEGMAYAENIGISTVIARGTAAAEGLFLYPGDRHLSAPASSTSSLAPPVPTIRTAGASSSS
ncbi:hypothetical protein [Streptomyces sp. NPDC055692]|uniref:hypothetical protein n=1 Tax=Streptomyces sp. NPDC055692 TaxID=3155683 RepID=UPI00343844D4